MYDRAVGATYPDKYKNTRQLVENNPQVEKLIVDIFGKNNLAVCDKANKKELLKAALKWNFHRFGWGAIANFCNLNITILKLPLLQHRFQYWFYGA